MTETEQDGARAPALLARPAFTRTTEHYVLAVVGYLVIGVLTKTLLTFTMALMYFVLTLDLLPRGYARLRHPAWPKRSRP